MTGKGSTAASVQAVSAYGKGGHEYVFFGVTTDNRVFCCAYNDGPHEVVDVRFFGTDSSDVLAFRHVGGTAFLSDPGGSASLLLTIIGYDGDDEIWDTPAGQSTLHEQMSGREGDDLITCDSSALIFGDGGADLIWGSDEDDWIYGDSPPNPYGLDGPDEIHGEGGADEIHGEGGADLVCSGGGADEVAGDDGADTIWGGPAFLGTDSISGGPQWDECGPAAMSPSCDDTLAVAPSECG